MSLFLSLSFQYSLSEESSVPGTEFSIRKEVTTGRGEFREEPTEEIFFNGDTANGSSCCVNIDGKNGKWKWKWEKEANVDNIIKEGLKVKKEEIEYMDYTKGGRR